MHECQSSLEVLGNSRDDSRNTHTRAGKIDWEQDLFQAGHYELLCRSPLARWLQTSSKASVEARITGPSTIPASPNAISPPRIERRIPSVWIRSSLAIRMG